MSKSDAQPAGYAICDHCDKEGQVNSGGIGSFYYPLDGGAGQLVWLCRAKCQGAWEKEHCSQSVTCAQCGKEAERWTGEIWPVTYPAPSGDRITRWLCRLEKPGRKSKCQNQWEARYRDYMNSKREETKSTGGSGQLSIV